MKGHHNNARDAQVGDITFAAGYVARYLEDYAQSREIPATVLTAGVASVIRGLPSGEVLWAQERLPSLRRQTPEGLDRNQASNLDDGAHRQTSKPKRKLKVKDKAHVRTSGPGSYWDKLSPAARSQEMGRRAKVRDAKRRKVARAAKKLPKPEQEPVVVATKVDQPIAA